MDVEKELQGVRERAAIRANRRIVDFQRKLWLDGKADRAAMGNPDPTLGEVFGKIGRNFREFAETVRHYFNL